MKRKILYVAVILSVVGAGCASLRSLLSSFKKPKLVFREAQLANATLSGITLNLLYSLENPNPIGLNVASVSYQLFIDGKSVVSGAPSKGMEIRAKGSTPVSFPATIEFASIAPVVETFLSKDYAPYEAKGHVGIQTPLGVLKLPVDVSGQFEVPKIPAIALEPPNVSQLGLAGATLQLPITLSNRNTYPLPIQALAGALKIAGSSVGEISSGSIGVLPGKASQRISIPVRVNFAQAVNAAQALRSGRGQFSLAGQVLSGQAQIPFQLNQDLAVRR